MKHIVVLSLFVLLINFFVKSGDDSPLWIRGKDDQVVSFSSHLICDSVFLSTAMQRAGMVDDTECVLGSINTISEKSKEQSMQKAPYVDLVNSDEGLLLEKTLLSHYCSGNDLRYYRRLLTMVLGGLSDAALEELRGIAPSKAFLVSWMADYLCSRKMKKLCTKSLPHQLVKAFFVTSVLTPVPNSEFLDHVAQWSAKSSLQNFTKGLVQKSFKLEKLPFTGVGDMQLFGIGRHLFVLQEDRESLFLCKRQNGEQWVKNKIFGVKDDEVIRHCILMGKQRLAVVAYSKKKNLSRFYVVFHLGDPQKPIRVKNVFSYKGKIGQAAWISHNTFAWSIGSSSYSACWDCASRSWIQKKIGDLENEIQKIVVLGSNHFALFSRCEAQIFVYDSILKDWVCRYNRVFASGEIFGIVPLLKKYAVISINRLLFLIPCSLFGELWEKACLGLPYLGTIKPQVIGQDMLILQGSKETASMVVNEDLQAFLRILYKQPDIFIVPGSKEQIFIARCRDIWCLEPLLGTKNVRFCGKARAPIAHGCRLSSSNIIFSDEVGNIYRLFRRKIEDKKVLLAAACMKAYQEKTGQPLPVVPSGWIANVLGKSDDGDWLESVMDQGYGLAAEASKKICTVM